MSLSKEKLFFLKLYGVSFLLACALVVLLYALYAQWSLLKLASRQFPPHYTVACLPYMNRWECMGYDPNERDPVLIGPRYVACTRTVCWRVRRREDCARE